MSKVNRPVEMMEGLERGPLQVEQQAIQSPELDMDTINPVYDVMAGGRLGLRNIFSIYRFEATISPANAFGTEWRWEFTRAAGPGDENEIVSPRRPFDAVSGGWGGTIAQSTDPVPYPSRFEFFRLESFYWDLSPGSDTTGVFEIFGWYPPYTADREVKVFSIDFAIEGNQPTRVQLPAPWDFPPLVVPIFQMIGLAEVTDAGTIALHVSGWAQSRDVETPVAISKSDLYMSANQADAAFTPGQRLSPPLPSGGRA